MDQRKHPRLPKCLPLEFKAGQAAKSSKTQGVVGNISLGGMYFQCSEPPKLASGQILEFTVAISSDNPLATDHHHEVSYFKGSGSVVRVESPKKGSPFYGIAVQFSQPLTLAGMMETQAEVTPAPETSRNLEKT